MMPRAGGPCTTNDMQTPPLRSGNLDMKDPQRAENKDGRKISYHIISCLDVAGDQKWRFGGPKIQPSPKVAKFEA